MERLIEISHTKFLFVFMMTIDLVLIRPGLVLFLSLNHALLFHVEKPQNILSVTYTCLYIVARSNDLCFHFQIPQKTPTK